MPRNAPSNSAPLVFLHCGVICCAVLQPTHADILLVSGGGNVIKRYDLATGAYTGNFADLDQFPYRGYPWGLTVGAFKDIVVTDPAEERIWAFNMHTGASAPRPNLGNGFFEVGDIEFNPADNSMYWLLEYSIRKRTDPYSPFVQGSVTEINPCGLPSGGGNPKAWGSTIGPDGDLYVACWNQINGQRSVKRIDLDTFTDMGSFAIGGGLTSPQDLLFGPDGALYVTDRNSNSVLKYDGLTGVFMGVFASGIPAPYGLGFGEDGDLYVASNTGDLIHRLDGLTGLPVGTLPSGGLNNPTHLIIIPEPCVGLLVLLGVTMVRWRAKRET